MQNGSPDPPPTQPASTTQEQLDAPVEPTANDTMQNEAPSALTEIALEVVAVLTLLF